MSEPGRVISARRRLLFVAGAVAIATAGAVLAGEIAARFMGLRPMAPTRPSISWAEQDPVLGWINATGTFESHEQRHASMTFWAGGRRATRADSAPSGAPLVLVVGGSFTQGYDVRDEQTFVWQLQRRFPDLDFENYGTGGYGTYQSLLMLERLAGELESPPELVIYGFGHFHAQRNVATFLHLRALRVQTGHLSPPRVSLDAGRLERHPLELLPEWPLEGVSALINGLRDFYFARSMLGRAFVAVPATSRLLEEMNRTVEEMGSHLLVAVLVGGPQPRRFLEPMREAGIEFVNCSHRIDGRGHPRPKVHARWARCIGAWLEQRAHGGDGSGGAAAAAP